MSSYNIETESHFDEFDEEMQTALERALTIIGQTCEGYAKENITAVKAVDTGNLRNSITNKVDAGEKKVIIGTAVEYGKYIEFGTGIHAEEGGRQTPWVYQDSEGKWHRTSGMRPRPFLRPAAADHLDEYRNIIETELKG